MLSAKASRRRLVENFLPLTPISFIPGATPLLSAGRPGTTVVIWLDTIVMPSESAAELSGSGPWLGGLGGRTGALSV